MKAVAKYANISKITMSNSLVYFWNFFSRNVFFIFIMFIYLMLWKNIYSVKGSTIAGLTLNSMIWYLAITEVITLSRTDIHIQINDDVKTGAIAYVLNKPYNYIGYCFSYFLGEIGVKMVTNGLIAILIGFIYIGPLENFKLITLPFILISILIGSFINFFIYISIALLSFWVEENNAFFWVYSKLVFTLGGMLMPIDLFPVWLRTISKYLPFAYVTYVPGKLAVDFTMEAFVSGVSIQLIYLFIFVMLSLVLFRKGAKNLNVNGG